MEQTSFNPRNFFYIGDNFRKSGIKEFSKFCQDNKLDEKKLELELKDQTCICGMHSTCLKNRNYICSNDKLSIFVISNRCKSKYSIKNGSFCSVCLKVHSNRNYDVCNDCGKCGLHPKSYIGECSCFELYSWDKKESKNDGKVYFEKIFRDIKARVKICGTGMDRIIWFKLIGKKNDYFNDDVYLSPRIIPYPDRNISQVDDNVKCKWYREHMKDIETLIQTTYDTLIKNMQKKANRQE